MWFCPRPPVLSLLTMTCRPTKKGAILIRNVFMKAENCFYTNYGKKWVMTCFSKCFINIMKLATTQGFLTIVRSFRNDAAINEIIHRYISKD